MFEGQENKVIQIHFLYFNLIVSRISINLLKQEWWSFTTQNGDTFESTAKLKQEGDKVTGTVTGRNGNEAAVEDGAIKNNEVSFKVVRERDGQKFTAKYKGELKGDAIKGTVERERDGQTTSRDWEAKRAKE